MNDWWKCPRCAGKGAVEGTRCGLCIGMGELPEQDFVQHCDDLCRKFVKTMAVYQPLSQHSPIGGEHGHNR